MYLNDKKHGFGKYKWADGRRYIGYWQNGKQNGYAKYVMANCSTHFGIWTKGKRTSWLSDEQIEKLKSNKDFVKILNEN
jgi:hypothetical protein